MARKLILALALLAIAQPAFAWPHRGPKYYSGHNPPVRFPSGAYGGYAGSAYYLHDKIYPSPFPGYHWADATMFSTGPGSTYIAPFYSITNNGPSTTPSTSYATPVVPATGSK